MANGSATQTDVAIIGGGIVGLATAYQLSQRHRQLSVVVLEKESELGVHQTGHNSGVLHSGIYYKPGSLKALNCRAGKSAMEQFCQQHDVPFEICGKVIVAVHESETVRLQTILQRGHANDVSCQLIGPERLAELEPQTPGIQAIHVPEAGIVDFRQACRKMAELVVQRNGEVWTNSRVVKTERTAEGILLHCPDKSIRARYAVNCGGLHSDRVTRMCGRRPEARIVPFRGEYYELKPDARQLCRNLIYPVPDPAFPFLGVHFTRMIDGTVECGPNAVLAFAREGYRKTDINFRDLAESLTYAGFLRLSARYWRVGLGEMWRSYCKRAFVKALQRLLPAVDSEMLIPARAGVRAQAISPAGQIIDDFVIQADERVVHVGNAPSPAATSSLNIGSHVVGELERLFGK